MPESVQQRRERLAREKTLYRYSSALEDGDLDTITAVLQEAEQDRALEQQIIDLHIAYQEAGDVAAPAQEAVGTLPPDGDAVEALPAPMPPPRLREQSRGPLRLWGSLAQKLVAVLLVGLLLGSVLALYAARHSAGNGTPPVVAHPSTVVVLAFDDAIHAFRPGDGAPLWTYPAAQPVVGPSIVVQGTAVYAASWDGTIFALGALDGKLLWQQQVQTSTSAGVSLSADGQVVVVSYPLASGDAANGKKPLVAALDPRDGHLLWQWQAPLVDFDDPLLGVGNKVVYVETTTPQGVMTNALSEADGALLWSAPSLSGIETPYTVAITNGTLYLSGAHSLQALDAQTGKQRWEQDRAIGGAIVAGNGQVYLNTGPEICAYQMSDGSQGWCSVARHDSSSGYFERFSSSLLFMDDTLYVGRVPNTNPGRLTIEAWDASTGKPRWSRPGFNSGPSNFAGANGLLYTPAPEGLYALRGSDGHQSWLARIPLPINNPLNPYIPIIIVVG